MSADERLVVMLEARVTEFEKRMRQAEQRGTKTYQGLRQKSRSATRAMEADMARSSASINRALATTAARIGAFGAAFAGARAVAGYNRLADAATAMANSLRVAGLEGAELTRVFEKLFASAQRNSTPINALVDLYSKLALTQTELGVSSDDLIRFTDGIAVALKVAGTDANTASGSLLQLSQALGGGVVRAEEFNSILEGTPTIAQAVARGLKEAGGSVAELRKLVVGGEVSSTAFFRAFEAGSAHLREQADTSQTTVAQAMTRIGNSLVTVVGEFDQATGASESLARILGEVADAVDGFDASGLVAEVQRIVSALEDAEEAVSSWLRKMADAQAFADLNDAMGISEDGNLLNPDVREAEKKIGLLEREVGTLQASIEKQTEMGFDASEAIARLREVRAELAAVRAEAANLPRYIAGMKPDGSVTYNMTDSGTGISGYTAPPLPVKPVSTEDFPVDPDDEEDDDKKDKGSRGGRRSRGGGGGSSRADDYAREAEAIRERTQAMQIEAAQLVAVAAGQRDLGDAMEFASAKADLLTAAQKAGKTITPELEAEIDQLAQTYMTAGMAAEEAADKLRQIEEQSERGKDALSDMFGSIIDGSMSAKDAVVQLLAEIAKAQMMRGLTGLPGFGQASSFIGGLLGFASGGYTGSGGKYEPAGIVHRGEYVMDAEATKRIGVRNLEAMQRGRVASPAPAERGGKQDVNVTVSVDQNGNLQAFVDKRVAGGVQAGIKARDRNFNQRVVEAQNNHRKRRG
jgi:tape measure domain-containing protein